MLNFVLGPSGSGKTQWLIDRANEDVATDVPPPPDGRCAVGLYPLAKHHQQLPAMAIRQTARCIECCFIYMMNIICRR